ncbi:MAG: DUF2341 domain-containing protein [Saprospiraceae bacterium]|nr:DUF2341 domain-containing protein [Saprospiraceae bacterium]
MRFIYLLLSFVLIFGTIEAQDCFTTFKYYKAITLTPDAAIAAHTIAIPFDSKSLVDGGKLLADGSDLRVVDADCNTLPFFIQDLANRDKNILYVAIPDIDPSGLELQVYYGATTNVSSEIDGTSVFLFFDDFEDGVVDMDTWENVGSYANWEESDGKMRYTGMSGSGGIFLYVTPKVAYTSPVTFDFVAPANNNKFYGICDTGDIERVGFRYQSGAQSNDTMDIYAVLRDTINGGFFPGDFYPFIVVEREVGNIMSIAATISPSKTLIVDRFENHSNGEANYNDLVVANMEFNAIRPFFTSFGASIAVDFVGIRSTPQGFPVITTGQEVQLITSTKELSGINSFECFPNPVTNTIRFNYENPGNITLTITNNLGKQVHNQSDLQSLDISQWPAGWYIVKLKDGEKTISKKIVVNK